MNHWDTVKKVRGIYKVTNKVNGKVYIGQSVDIGRRWRQHMTAEDDIYFHKAIQKYGVDNFIWEVIEKCKKSELDERESYWIEYYDSFNKGYNCTKGGGISGGSDHPNWKGGVTLNENYSKLKQKQYVERHKEQRKQYQKQYYEEHKEKKKQYNEEHKEQIKQQMKQYNEEHKEYRKQQMKQYYEDHKEELKEKRKQRYLNQQLRNKH